MSEGSWTKKLKQTFIDKGLKCPGCGRNYKQIKEVRPPGRKDAELITLDHIAPRSIGGETVQWNIRVVCFDCNMLKADQWPWDWDGGQKGVFAKKVEWPSPPDPKEVAGEEEAWEWTGQTVQTYMDQIKTPWSIEKGRLVDEIELLNRETGEGLV